MSKQVKLMTKLKSPKNYRKVRQPRSCWNCKYLLKTWPENSCARNNPKKWEHWYLGNYVCDGHRKEATNDKIE